MIVPRNTHRTLAAAQGEAAPGEVEPLTISSTGCERRRRCGEAGLCGVGHPSKPGFAGCAGAAPVRQSRSLQGRAPCEAGLRRLGGGAGAAKPALQGRAPCEAGLRRLGGGAGAAKPGFARSGTLRSRASPLAGADEARAGWRRGHSPTLPTRSPPDAGTVRLCPEHRGEPRRQQGRPRRDGPAAVRSVSCWQPPSGRRPSSCRPWWRCSAPPPSWRSRSSSRCSHPCPRRRPGRRR